MPTRFAILSYFFAFVLLMLWTVVLIPLLCRLFGLRLPLNPRQRIKDLRQGSIGRQIAIDGVLSWGVGMFLSINSIDVIQARYFHDTSVHPAIGWMIFFSLLFWMTAGILFGWTQA